MDEMSVWRRVRNGDLVYVCVPHSFRQCLHTDVQQDCSIVLLAHDMVLKDLVIEGSGLGVGGWHFEGKQNGSTQRPDL